MSLTQSRNWCFTDFELLDWGKIYSNAKDTIRFIRWGQEICPKTKKKHLQGWIQFINKKRLGGAKKACQSKKISIRACRGSEDDNEVYCQKDKKAKSVGDFIVQGQRTDLEQIKKIIDEGATMYNVAQENFQLYVQYGRGLEKYKQMVDKKKRSKFRKVDVVHIHGKTGKGKTRGVFSDDKVDTTYKIQGKALQWFDGYDGEETLLIDEYDNDIPITELLGLLDGYQLRLPIKGGFTYANWTKVYITSNIRRLHRNAKKEHRRALKRRITETINMCRGT